MNGKSSGVGGDVGGGLRSRDVRQVVVGGLRNIGGRNVVGVTSGVGLVDGVTCLGEEGFESELNREPRKC